MKKKLFILIFVLILMVPLLDLFHPGLPITHDGQDHVARIANFYKNLEEGNIIPRWAANLNWGYGHPILMFLYPLPSYIASLFHLFGFSLADSVKIVFGLAFIASGFFMYLWTREFLGDMAGFIAGVLYLFAPYRFVDLYVRGAIGEHVAFVFPPLILYFLLRLIASSSTWLIVGGALSLAGLILSHNAITLMFLPIILLYTLFLLWQSKSKKLLVMSYWLLVMLGFGLSAFFWVPAFFEGKYTLRDIVTLGEYTSRFVLIQDLIYGQWNYGGSGQFTTQVGIVHWLMIFLSVPSIVLLKRKRNNLWILTLGSLTLFVATLFLMTNASKFVWETATTLQKFQFPWRFLSVTVFTTAVLGGIVISVVPKKTKLIACCLLIFAVLLLNKDYWYAEEFFIKSESFYTGIYPSTTDTGESSPIWSVRFMEKEPKGRIEVIDGKASAVEIKRTSTIHEYKIEAKEKSRIRENTLYFPGWEVFVDGQKTDIEFQDPDNRGLITFFLEKGKHSVKVIFSETKLRQVADLISIASISSLLAVSLLWKKLLQREMV